MMKTNIKRVYWTDADWSHLRETAAYRRDHTHSNLVGAFDLESSAVTAEQLGIRTLEQDIKHEFAFMYVWQVGVEDTIAYGRTWDELRECLLDIHEQLRLSPDYKLIVFDQKMKYDFHFFKSELEISDKDFLAKDLHDVIKATVADVFEFRDSKIYTERDLATMGEEIGIPKVSGYDYGLIRHALTPLSDFELNYCCVDVEILLRYFREERNFYKYVKLIPLTGTRIPKEKIYHYYRERASIMSIRASQLRDTPEDLIMLGKLQKALFGAFNYSSIAWDNVIKDDVTYADISTMYGSLILLEKFPLKKFKPLPIPEDSEELLSEKYKNTALLMTIRVRGVKNKYPCFYTFPVSKEWEYHKKSLKIYKDKLMSCDKIIMTITDIDYKLLRQFYDVKSVDVLELYGSRYAPLPNYITQTVIDLYRDKKKAGEIMAAIEADREPTEAEQSQYDRIKTMVARIYGIFVQKPLLPRYTIKPGGLVEAVRDDENNIIYDFVKKEHDPVLYQWGVWVTALGRAAILRTVAAITLEERGGRGVNNDNVLYTDTDGLYAIGDITHIIAQYNTEIKQKLRYFCNMNRMYRESGYKYEELEGIGEFKVKHFKHFKTIGLKKYAYITERDDFITKISGLSRDNVYFDKFPTAIEKLEALQPEMEIGAEEARNRIASYYNDKITATVIDYTGQPLEVVSRSYIVLGVQKFDSRRYNLRQQLTNQGKKIELERNKCLRRALLKTD
ncbi:MAG: hypothetical protein J6R30_08340 [Bacteroidales bacterium]|nr:hypothetical protein [Bacteroidales bacterium]MBO6032406.1 hypothetical protein [Prevotella sp.]